MTGMIEDEKFAAALEECCRRQPRGEDDVSFLDEYPAEYRTELARLVPLSARLDNLRRDPAPAFQARLETRLLATYDVARQPSPARRGGFLGPLWRTLRRLPTAAVLVVILLLASGGGVGVVQASDGSLPDSPLYSVKTAREWLSLNLASNPENKVGVYAGLINERSRELERAVRLDKPRRVIVALSVGLSWTVDQAVDAARALQTQGRPQPAARATTALLNAQRQVEKLAAQASPQTRPVLQRLNVFLGDEARRLSEPVL
jgi:hypothetical protein